MIFKEFYDVYDGDKNFVISFKWKDSNPIVNFTEKEIFNAEYQKDISCFYKYKVCRIIFLYEEMFVCGEDYGTFEFVNIILEDDNEDWS